MLPGGSHDRTAYPLPHSVACCWCRPWGGCGGARVGEEGTTHTLAQVRPHPWRKAGSRRLDHRLDLERWHPPKQILENQGFSLKKQGFTLNNLAISAGGRIH